MSVIETCRFAGVGGCHWWCYVGVARDNTNVDRYMRSGHFARLSGGEATRPGTVGAFFHVILAFYRSWHRSVF